MPALKKIAIIGSGNWGSAIAIHVGEKLPELKNEFEQEVSMWCKEEQLEDGSNLSDVINEKRENTKYLPNQKFPDGIVAVPDLVKAAENADVLIFVLPHQYTRQACDDLVGKIKPTSFAMTLIKGFYIDENTGELLLVSEIIKKTLNIPCVSLMGANIAKEVADKIFCEATVGSRDKNHSSIVRQLFDRSHFRLRFYPDVEIIEILGAVKNVIAMLAGFGDGLKAGFNTRAAILRLGFREMIGFCRLYAKESSPDIYLESCGIADLIASALGGRNYNGAKIMVEENKSLKDFERDNLNGQLLQGPGTAKEVYTYLKSKNLLDQFPMFRDAYLICEGEILPSKLLDNLTNHPEYNQVDH